MRKDVHQRRINILVATDHAGYEGSLAGVGRYLLNTLPAIDREQFKITLIVLRDAASLEQRLDNTEIVFRQLGRRKFDPFTLLDFTRIIREQNIDVIHVHQYATSNFGRIAGLITGRPVILHIHGPDLHYPAYQKFADRLLTGVTDRALAVSESARKACINNRSIRPDRITTLPNGVPLDKLVSLNDVASESLKKHWSIPHGSLIIGTVTRLHEEKGNQYFIEAAGQVLKKIPDAYFMVVGEGPLMEELQVLARKLEIQDRVCFTGFQDQISALLSIFDVMVLPSLAEGHPQALLEAMAMGKAVVSTTAGGIGEIIRDGVEGFLVAPEDDRALADRIAYLLQNPKDRALMGAAGHVKSRDYSLQAHISKLEDIYRSMVKEPGG